MFRDEVDHPRYVLFEYEETNPPYQILKYCTDHNSFVLALNPGTISYSDFIQETLPEWEKFCDEEGVVLESRNLDRAPLPDVYTTEVQQFVRESEMQKQKERSSSRFSLFVNDSVSLSSTFESDEDWRNVLNDLTL